MTTLGADLRGRFFHIAGSASAKAKTELIAYAHQLVSSIAAYVVEHGGALVLSAGKEPRQDDSNRNSPALLFDWTALSSAAAILVKSTTSLAGAPSIVVVMSEKGESEIPAERQQLWTEMLRSGHVRLEHIRPGARSAAMIRERQAQFGDALLCIGGGTGVEHLADIYIARRKPVIPFDLPIGASREDGTGGAQRLNREARANPHVFVRLSPDQQGGGGTLLALLGTKEGRTDTGEVVTNLSRLVAALDRPIAFNVRLLSRDVAEFNDVETFFRRIVDPVVSVRGHRRIEMGTDPSRQGFLNVEIFDTLHYASMIVVDITGHRPNCFIELGYGLGRLARVIVTAKRGTPLPFDQKSIPCFFWTSDACVDDLRTEFETFVERHLNRPPLVT